MNLAKSKIWFEKGLQIIIEKRTDEITRFDSLRDGYYLNYWKRVAEGMSANIEDLGGSFLRIKWKSKCTFVRNYEVSLDNHLILKIAGNKHIANRLLAEEGFPVPKFCKYNIESLENAIEFLNNQNRPIVVKPSGGGGGRGVTMGIVTEKQLKRASYHAALFGNQFIAEEEISGHSYRLLYLDGKFIDAVRRDPPVITGDGISTIQQLIKKSNTIRLNQEPVTALSPLTITMALREKLKDQGLSLKSIPKAGESVVVKSVVNQNSSSENHLIRDEVHPKIVKLGEEVVKHFGIKLAGLDIIANSLSEPLSKSAGVINEINTTPGLHHHDLVAETDQRIDVGRLILEYIFNNDVAIP